MNISFRTFAVALIGCSFAFANADIAYNNFGTGDTFLSNAWSVNSSQGLCMPFTSATTGQVSSITVALFSNANYTASLELMDNGNLPGTVLESWTFAGTGSAQTLSGLGTSNLVAGTSYWLEIEPATPSDSGAWYENDQGATGSFLFSNGGTWSPYNNTLSVFRVETNPVPEPMSMAVIGIGLAALKLRRRR